jgi:hypothetical protein
MPISNRVSRARLSEATWYSPTRSLRDGLQVCQVHSPALGDLSSGRATDRIRDTPASCRANPTEGLARCVESVITQDRLMRIAIAILYYGLNPWSNRVRGVDAQERGGTRPYERSRPARKIFTFRSLIHRKDRRRRSAPARTSARKINRVLFPVSSEDVAAFKSVLTGVCQFRLVSRMAAYTAASAHQLARSQGSTNSR